MHVTECRQTLKIKEISTLFFCKFLSKYGIIYIYYLDILDKNNLWGEVVC